MRPLAALFAALFLAGPALAADQPARQTGAGTVILTDPQQGRTLGKVGNQKVFCHTDPTTGVTLCK